ncbi:MAG: MarR family winged helix-turn-helix transcriptional regulator [Nocardioidaceae bacterium]
MNGTGTRATTGASLVELLTVAQRRVARAAAAALCEEGFTVDQWRILRALADSDGHSMGELAEALAMPAPTLTRLTEGLVDLGLLYRRQAEGDRRRTDVHLARQGRARLERLDALVEAAEDALRRSPEWDALRATLRRVHEGSEGS